MTKKEREGKLDQMKEGRETKKQTIRGREKRKRKTRTKLVEKECKKRMRKQKGERTEQRAAERDERWSYKTRGKIKLYLNPIFGDFPRSSKNRFPHLKNIFDGYPFI